MNDSPVPVNRRKQEFDAKLKKIEADEAKLKALEQELIRLQVRMATEAAPILQEFCDLRFENLTKLQQCLVDAYFKKKEKALIAQLMTELAIGLQSAGDPRAQAFLDALLSKEAEEDNDTDEEEFEYQPPPKFRPPSNKGAEAEGKLEIKALFRQLAKAFHPDKEPLEHLKEEKTSLMQKITAAYENDDLYGLLKLEKEHLGVRELTDDKLELYIKHINDRLKEVKAFEGRLKKYGPLAAIYKFIYAHKSTIQEYNVRNELSKIEDEVQREKELQSMIWDRVSLRDLLKS